jgi:hypothetical protein
MNRLLELASSVDAHLRQFGAVDLRREPYSWESPDAQPSGPGLYINGVKDKALMNLPTTGKAVVEYRIKRRNINEDNRDGVPTYGADIDVFSIEDYDDEEEEEGETGLSAVERFINFEGGYSDANVQKVYNRRKNKIDERVVLEPEKGGKALLKRSAGLAVGGAGGALLGHIANKKGIKIGGKGVMTTAVLAGLTAGDLVDGHRAKNRAADFLKKKGQVAGENYQGNHDPRMAAFSSIERFINFSDRDRNEQGQFAPGSSVSPDDFRIAGVAMKKKKVAATAAGVAGAAGVAAALSPQVRDTAAKVGKGLVSGASRMLLRR